MPKKRFSAEQIVTQLMRTVRKVSVEFIDESGDGADSDEVTWALRDDVARCSDIMPSGPAASLAHHFLHLRRWPRGER